LVFSLILLSLMLVVAVGSYLASTGGTKTSNDSINSVSAFQAADAGVEEVFRIINEKITTRGPLTSLEDARLCNDDFRFVDEDSLRSRKIVVTFYDKDGDLIDDCNGATLGEIGSIKSVGEFAGTARAVVVEVEE